MAVREGASIKNTSNNFYSLLYLDEVFKIFVTI